MKIERNIPPPEYTQDNRVKYPFRELKVGDSFFVDGKEKGHRARAAARQMTVRTNITLLTRSENGGVRIWRIK